MDAIYSDYQPTFLYVDKYCFSSKWSYPPNLVPYALVRYVVSGEAVFKLGEQEYHVKPDEVFFIPQGSLLSCTAKEEFVFISIRFAGSMHSQGNDLFQALWNFPLQHSFADQPQVKQWFEAIYSNAVSHHNFKALEIRGYLNLICGALARTCPGNFDRDLDPEAERKTMEAQFDIKNIQLRATRSLNFNDPRITVVLDYITTHPGENLTRVQLSEMAQMSESTLRRLFKEKTGKTIYEFMRDTKMINAARRLLVGNEPIAAIADALGYESPSYFSQCFKEVYGLSPLEYKKISHGT